MTYGAFFRWEAFIRIVLVAEVGAPQAVSVNLLKKICEK